MLGMLDLTSFKMNKLHDYLEETRVYLNRRLLESLRVLYITSLVLLEKLHRSSSQIKSTEAIYKIHQSLQIQNKALF